MEKAITLFAEHPSEISVGTDDSKRYGENESILPVGHRLSPLKPNDFTRLVLDRLDEMEFDPDLDYFVMSGDLRFVSMCLAIMLDKYDGVNMLMFDAVTGHYEVRRITAPSVGVTS